MKNRKERAFYKHLNPLNELIDMVSSDIIEYVKEQLKAGYSSEEIRVALLAQGWTEEDVDEVFTFAGPPSAQPITPPVTIKKGGNKGFLISLLGGLILFIFGLETVLSLPVLSSLLVGAGLIIAVSGFFEALLLTSLNSGVVILIFAVVIILGALLLHREGKEKRGGILIIVFSVLSLIGFNGFLLFVGAVLGIIGGILGMIKR